MFFCPSRRAPQTVTFSDPAVFNGQNLTHALCDYAASNLDGSGVVRQFEPNRIADVLDGMSGTLLVSEKRLDLNQLGQPQSGDNEGYSAGWDEDTVRRTDKGPAPDYRGGSDGKRFGSSHPGVFNALFTDGSVRPLEYTIDRDVFQRLGAMNDGQIVSGQSY